VAAGTFYRVIQSDRFGDAVAVSETLVRLVETVTAYILVGLFAVGVFDLGLVILELTLSGRITEASEVVDLIDTALLLLIIVEIYQTLVAYIQKNEPKLVVRTVIYAGVIAMVRKIIVFQTGDYASATDALVVASSYTLILVGLGALLFVNYRVSWEKEETTGTENGGGDTG
jgi:uncharacterized membrane protein (DUF373 family)